VAQHEHVIKTSGHPHLFATLRKRHSKRGYSWRERNSRLRSPLRLVRDGLNRVGLRCLRRCYSVIHCFLLLLLQHGALFLARCCDLLRRLRACTGGSLGGIRSPVERGHAGPQERCSLAVQDKRVIDGIPGAAALKHPEQTPKLDSFSCGRSVLSGTILISKHSPSPRAQTLEQALHAPARLTPAPKPISNSRRAKGRRQLVLYDLTARLIARDPLPPSLFDQCAVSRLGSTSKSMSVFPPDRRHQGEPEMHPGTGRGRGEGGRAANKGGSLRSMPRSLVDEWPHPTSRSNLVDEDD